MSLSYCKKCHEKKREGNFETTIKEINKISGLEVVDYDCQSYCGPGIKKAFVVIDDEIIEADSKEQLMIKIKEIYDN